MTEATDFAGPGGPPRRCLTCAYVLDHLVQRGKCPECGRFFDLSVPGTYTRKPPYVATTFWLPGFLTAFVSGAVLYLLLVPLVGYGWSTTFAIPLAAGVLLGYRVRAGKVVSVLLSLVLALSLMLTLLTLSVTGGLCTLILLGVSLGPILVGMGVGVLLRNALKATRFTQRAHLPLIVGGVLLLAAIEGRHTGMAIVSTSTVATINATPEQSWAAIQFYEQVRHRPPLLLWVSPSLRPQYTRGQSEHAGDRKVCVYARGRLVKEVTAVEPGRRLAFRVVEQTDIENDGVRLIDGSFELSPAANGHGTVVTLTTRYEPKLAPRFAYLPAERLAVHTLHEHVLRGMREDAERATQ